MSSYFVTGATGFIGRRLTERLLEREGTIYALVRPTSLDKLTDLISSLGAQGRIIPVEGDLAQPMFGLPASDVERLKEEVGDFFHLAAIYDMTADDERNRIANVEGTRNAVALANALDSRIHHVSSIAVAGDHKGIFREDMFDEGQPLSHRLPPDEVRGRADRPRPTRPSRGASTARRSSSAIRRPARWTRSTVPYYFFKAIQKARSALPAVVPAGRPGARRHEHRARSTGVAARSTTSRTSPGLDGQAFHLADPKPQRVGRRAQLVRPRGARARSSRCASTARCSTRCRRVRCRDGDAAACGQGRQEGDPRRPRHPGRGARHVGLAAPFDTRDADATLAGSRDRAAGRSTTTPGSCGTTGSATSTPTSSRTARSRRPSRAAPS